MSPRFEVEPSLELTKDSWREVDMNTLRLASLLLIVGPIGMFVIWGFIDPAIIGQVEDGLAPAEEALANLQLGLDNEVADNILSILGGLCFVGIFAGLALLARSLQAGGANLATLCTVIFPALIAVAIGGFGLSLEATSLLKKGLPDSAVALELVSNGMFGAVPLFWGLGVLLIGLAITKENGPIPAAMGWILAVVGVAMFSGTFIEFGNSPVGFAIWIGMTVTIVATGVVSLRKAA